MQVSTTEHDHYPTYESLRLTALRSGASLRKVALYAEPAEASAAKMVQAIEAAIAPATRVVAITWVHCGTGVKTPVCAIADAVARVKAARSLEARILLCVDCVHGFGAEDVTLADPGCDCFVVGTRTSGRSGCAALM